jgi:hypothetical protein
MKYTAVRMHFVAILAYIYPAHQGRGNQRKLMLRPGRHWPQPLWGRQRANERRASGGGTTRKHRVQFYDPRLVSITKSQSRTVCATHDGNFFIAVWKGGIAVGAAGHESEWASRPGGGTTSSLTWSEHQTRRAHGDCNAKRGTWEAARGTHLGNRLATSPIKLGLQW